MYACGSDGGVWKTQDFVSGAPRWTPLTDRQVSLNTAGYHPLTVHPADHQMVLAGVSGHGAGVLVSTDGGTEYVDAEGQRVFDVGRGDDDRVHPGPTRRSCTRRAVERAPLGGVWKSTDGGQNCDEHHRARCTTGPGSDIIVASDDGHTLYAGFLTGASAGV